MSSGWNHMRGWKKMTIRCPYSGYALFILPLALWPHCHHLYRCKVSRTVKMSCLVLHIWQLFGLKLASIWSLSSQKCCSYQLIWHACPVRLSYWFLFRDVQINSLYICSNVSCCLLWITFCFKFNIGIVNPLFTCTFILHIWTHHFCGVIAQERQTNSNYLYLFLV